MLTLQLIKTVAEAIKSE